MGKLSIVVNVVDEEVAVLSRAMESVKEIADEVILIDCTSSESLSSLAKEYGAKIYKHERVAYVEMVRNFGISKATGEWIFIIDPDEEVSESLQRVISGLVEKEEDDYYRIPRKNIIFGKWIKHSRWWPDYNIRLFKKGKVVWNEIIHTVPTTVGKGTDLEAKEENSLVHYHYETVEQYIERMNRYTSAMAKNLVEGGYNFDWTDLIHKPANEFWSRYFQGEGYKDGLHGFILAFLQAFGEFVVYLKIWSHYAIALKDKQIGLEDVTGVMKKVESDFHYWQADALLKEVGGIKYRIKRKFRLP